MNLLWNRYTRFKGLRHVLDNIAAQHGDEGDYAAACLFIARCVG